MLNDACISARNILMRGIARFEELARKTDESGNGSLTADERLERDILGMVFLDLRRIVERFDEAR
jgi:hypothetical protein